MKKIGGITKRWLKDIFSVILVLVLSVSVAACLFIRTYYYTSIKNVLETNSGELITTFFNIYGANSEDGFAIAGREFIENCGMLDLMEIWIIDNSGNVLLSSSGFEVSPQQNMPDFIEAMNSASGKATWVGKLSTGEKIMAMTESVMNTDGTAAGAIRYIVSLEDVDSQIGFSTDSRGYHCRINDTRTCIYSVYSKTSEKYRQRCGQGRGRRPQRPNRKLQIR